MRAVPVLLCLFSVAHATEGIPDVLHMGHARTDIKAFFVNLDHSKDRASCISRQLNEHRIPNARFAAMTMPTCNDFDFGCVTKSMEGHKDCFKNGADLIHIFTHGSQGNQTQMRTAAAVLANWCSHKRLFQQIQTNTSSNFDFGKLISEGQQRFLEKKSGTKSA